MATITVKLTDTTEVVAWIAANVAQTIADCNHPGHDLETVMRRMTTDKILGLIRSAYTFRCKRGDDRPESITLIGCRLVAEYLNNYDL